MQNRMRGIPCFWFFNSYSLDGWQCGRCAGLSTAAAAPIISSLPLACSVAMFDIDIHLVERTDAVFAEQLVDAAVNFIDGRVAIAQLFDIQTTS